MKIHILKNIKFVFFSVLLLSFVACEEEDKTFQGDPIFAFQDDFISNHFVKHIEPEFDIPVMLVGPHQNSDVSVRFEVIDYWVNADGDTIHTTAFPGQEYQEFSSHTISIPAGESFASIPIDFNFENLERDSVYFINFKLVDGDFDLSEIGNQYMRIRFIPHRVFIPEDYDGKTFTAFEQNNAMTREYPVTFELDSVYGPNNQTYDFLVDGLWGLQTADSTASAYDREKIRVTVNDETPFESIVAGETQPFFQSPAQGLVFWQHESGFVSGRFDTWENEFIFPRFDLDPWFSPPQGNSGTNVRVRLVLDED